MRVQKLVILFMLAVAGVSACGSSSKNGASGSTSPPPSSNPTGSNSSGSNGSSGATTSAPKLSGDSGSSFCDLARHDESALNNTNFATSTPADIKKTYENIGSAIAEAESKAPSSIKGDFQTLGTGLNKLAKALSDANYDYTKLSPETLTSLDTAEFKAASDHIEQYVTQVCKIDTSSPTSTP